VGVPIRVEHESAAPDVAVRPRVPGPTPTGSTLLRLQRTAGNAAVSALVVQRDRKGKGKNAGGGGAATAELSELDKLVADIEGPAKKKPAKAAAPAPKKKSEGQKRAEREARLRAEKQAAADAALAAKDAERRRDALAETKRAYDSESAVLLPRVAGIRAEAVTWSVGLAPLTKLEKAHDAAAKAATDDWTAAQTALRALSDELFRVGGLIAQKKEAARLQALKNAGRLGINGNEIPTQSEAAIAGDGVADEQAALTEALAALRTPAANPWRGGPGGKWGLGHANGEKNLPGGTTYAEYYVRPPADAEGFGLRRLVRAANGKIYYTWTHYGSAGNPPFVLLTA